MRDYQGIKNNPYLLPHHLYMRTLYIIRDYDRLKEKAEKLLDYCDKKPEQKFVKTPEEINKLKNIKDEPCTLSYERAALETDAIEGALEFIPSFYRDGVLENIMEGARYPLGADERTFRRYKQRYIYHVARLLNCV